MKQWYIYWFWCLTFRGEKKNRWQACLFFGNRMLRKSNAQITRIYRNTYNSISSNSFAACTQTFIRCMLYERMMLFHCLRHHQYIQKKKQTQICFLLVTNTVDVLMFSHLNFCVPKKKCAEFSIVVAVAVCGCDLYSLRWYDLYKFERWISIFSTRHCFIT